MPTAMIFFSPNFRIYSDSDFVSQNTYIFIHPFEGFASNIRLEVFTFHLFDWHDFEALAFYFMRNRCCFPNSLYL